MSAISMAASTKTTVSPAHFRVHASGFSPNGRPRREVEGLKPGREYWYRFKGSDGTLSGEGRFRTLPVGRVDDLVLAVVSCQLYPGGFYNAYADMAKRERLDAVIHLGDYIYEYGPEGYGGDIGKRLGRLPEPGHEILSLDDYRRRHAQVKADPDMQAAHARAAFICVWDDHEVTNDDWVGGAQNHQEDTEGAWSARKAVAMQAYFEWMPIRDPSAVRAKEAIFRSFEFGDLATLAMTETRLLARSKQLSFAGEPGNADDYAASAKGGSECGLIAMDVVDVGLLAHGVVDRSQAGLCLGPLERRISY